MFVQTWKKVRHGWLVIRCELEIEEVEVFWGTGPAYA